MEKGVAGVATIIRKCLPPPQRQRATGDCGNAVIELSFA
jgi:hypothetical protein